MINSFFEKYFFIFFIVFFTYSYSSTKINDIEKEKLEKIGYIPMIIGNDITFSKKIRTNKNCKDFFDPKDQFFIRKLMLYHAKKDPFIKIDDKELKLQYQMLFPKLIIRNNKNIKNLSQEEIIEMIKNEQYIQNFIKKITSDIEVTPKEIRDFLHINKNKIPFLPKMLNISYIIFYPKSKKKHNKITSLYNNIKNKIRSDLNFSSEKFKYPGLDIVSIKKLKINLLPKEFGNVIRNLKKGEISEPFETNLGFHLIKLEDNRNDEVDIIHVIDRKNNNDNKYDKNTLYKTKLYANTIRKRILNNKISLEDISKNKIENVSILENIWVNENNLSKNMIKALRHLRKGKISYPYEDTINGKKIFFILKFLDEIPSRPLSFDKDYIILENFIREMKKKEKIKEWAKSISNKTYIRINNCSYSS
ncbi:peptidylprolyl isomerase [Blattabacterium cuenoti]|uniref:peptidylprolyl isomerase n=1 Tax=Blattabacterium cuenoti TaxID=1653831 RepID=UPI00163B64B6|nr:peptidylprolyl isomerase [Blattabacterium cuenoti]